jgi:hypothetical protein
VGRERKTNRKGVRARRGVALLGGDWPKFAPVASQWGDLEKTLRNPIPAETRKRICEVTSKYLTDAQAERNAVFAGDYKKKLTEVKRLASRLEKLLFRGTTDLDDQVAGAALAGLDESIPPMDDDPAVLKVLRAEPYVETGTSAFESALQRVASNCSTEINRRHLPGFKEHNAWDVWIGALLAILREARLPHGVATTSYEDKDSPAVRFVHALQRLFWQPLRRHNASLNALAKAMMAARANKKRRKSER